MSETQRGMLKPVARMMDTLRHETDVRAVKRDSNPSYH